MKTTVHIFLAAALCAVNTLPAHAAQNSVSEDPCPYTMEYPATKASTAQKPVAKDAQAEQPATEKQVQSTYPAEEEHMAGSE